MLKPTTPEQLETLVRGKIQALLEERCEAVRPLAGTDKLNATLGLTSLDLAFLVADLEATLGLDPFARLVSITSVRSVDDLVGAYRQVLFGGDKRQAEADDVAAAKARADSRRARKPRR
jgi:acyl carrier protein